MNYYRRYPGDYARDTGHLTLAEHGAYNVLLDTIYATEASLPEEFESLYRICRAITPDEQKAVQAVAEQFFPVVDGGGRMNPRAGREVVVGRAAIVASRESGSFGGRAKWGSDQDEVNRDRDNRRMRSERLANARRLGRHTARQWDALLIICGKLCLKCGAENIVKDHIVPIYQGGSDGIDNLQPLCGSCNSRKGPDRTDHRPKDWEKRLEERLGECLPKRLETSNPQPLNTASAQKRVRPDRPPRWWQFPPPKILAVSSLLEVSTAGRRNDELFPRLDDAWRSTGQEKRIEVVKQLEDLT